jgi:hypothetical protein
MLTEDKIIRIFCFVTAKKDCKNWCFLKELSMIRKIAHFEPRELMLFSSKSQIW